MTTRRQGIIVGFDGSSEAILALEWAALAAARRGTSLTVLHAYQVPVVAGPVALGYGPQVVQEEAERVVSRARGHLAEAVAPGAARDARYETARGEPAGILVDRSKRSELVVVGRRGLRTFDRYLLGSVSSAVSAMAFGPVVVVPGTARPRTIARVVAGVDPADRAEEVLGLAFREADQAGVPLVAAHALDVDRLGELALEEGWADRFRDEAAAALAEVAARWGEKYPGVSWSTDLRKGRPAEVLLAGLRPDDLAVVGGRRHVRAVGRILGSVPDRLLTRAPCPVVVVHESA